MAGKRSYRPGRNRRIPQPGTPGGKVNGIFVQALEFRSSEETINLSIFRIGPTGAAEAVGPWGQVGSELPVAGITITNADLPGLPCSITAAEWTGVGTIALTVAGLPAGNIGTLLIPPLLPGWGDRYGNMNGGLYTSVPTSE